MATENTSNIINSTDMFHSLIARAAAIAYLSIVALLGTVGNILVIVSVVKTVRLQRLAYLLIANLSVVGLLVSLLVIPCHIYNIANVPGNRMSGILCKVEGYLNFMLNLAMILNSNAIAVYRYIMVSRQSMTIKRERYCYIVVVLTLMWVFPILLAFTSLPYVGYHKPILDCFIASTEESNRYAVIIISGPGIATFFFIATFYMLILKLVRRSHQKVTVSERARNVDDWETSCSEEISQTTRDVGDSIQMSPEVSGEFSSSIQLSAQIANDVTYPLQSPTSIDSNFLKNFTNNYNPQSSTLLNNTLSDSSNIKHHSKHQHRHPHSHRHHRRHSKMQRINKVQVSVIHISGSIINEHVAVTSGNISLAVGSSSEPTISRITRSKFHQEAKLSLQLFLVLALFSVMYIPICVIHIIQTMMPVHPDICLTVLTVARSFSTITWMLYGMLSRDLQDAYANILICKK